MKIENTKYQKTIEMLEISIKKKNKISNKIPKRKIREVGFCKNLWKFSAVR